MDSEGFAIVRVCVLASSSAGNCTFIGAGRTRILIDAGLSRTETFQRLAAIGEDPESLSAIVVTHEHSDHVAGLVPIARYYHKRGRALPLYLSHLTAPAIDWGEFTPVVEHFQAGSRISIGDLEVDTFTIPHDAVDPVGVTVRGEGIKAGLATDLGYLPDSVKVHLRGSDIVILEANHDLDMLKVGPYPWSVKQRVMGRKGHLSNDVACAFIRNELDTSVSTLVLGHLSENNNHPEIVRVMAAQALDGRQLFTRLTVAGGRRPSECFDY